MRWDNAYGMWIPIDKAVVYDLPGKSALLLADLYNRGTCQSRHGDVINVCFNLSVMLRDLGLPLGLF